MEMIFAGKDPRKSGCPKITKPMTYGKSIGTVSPGSQVEDISIVQDAVEIGEVGGVYVTHSLRRSVGQQTMLMMQHGEVAGITGIRTSRGILG